MFLVPTFGSSITFLFVFVVVFFCFLFFVCFFSKHTVIEELRVDIKSYHGRYTDSSYSCFKYDHLLFSKI